MTLIGAISSNMNRDLYLTNSWTISPSGKVPTFLVQSIVNILLTYGALGYHNGKRMFLLHILCLSLLNASLHGEKACVKMHLNKMHS